ncbi:hypothetical protein [Microbacterium aurum]
MALATATGSDGLSIGAGDLIQTKNSSDLGVGDRQQWIVHQVTDDGTVYVREVGNGRSIVKTRSPYRASMWVSMRTCLMPRPPTASKARP